MQQNVGSLDKGVRIALGLLLTVVSMSVLYVRPWDAATTGGVGGLALLVAAVMFVTATTEKCLLYAALGIDTLDE